MLICPVCKSEYNEGITKCPHCNVELVAPFSMEENMSQEEYTGRKVVADTKTVDEELVSIFSTNDYLEASMVKSLLEASGITVVEQQGMTFYGKPVDSLQYINLYVFKSHAEDAVRLIEQQERNNSN